MSRCRRDYVKTNHRQTQDWRVRLTQMLVCSVHYVSNMTSASTNSTAVMVFHGWTTVMQWLRTLQRQRSDDDTVTRPTWRHVMSDVTTYDMMPHVTRWCVQHDNTLHDDVSYTTMCRHDDTSDVTTYPTQRHVIFDICLTWWYMTTYLTWQHVWHDVSNTSNKMPDMMTRPTHLMQNDTSDTKWHDNWRRDRSDVAAR